MKLMKLLAVDIRSDKRIMFLFLLCTANLLFMHYSFRLTINRKITVSYVIQFIIAYVSEECQNNLVRNT